MGLMYYKPLDGGDPVPIAIGAQGEQGEKGDKGDKGDIGDTGGTEVEVTPNDPLEGTTLLWVKPIEEAAELYYKDPATGEFILLKTGGGDTEVEVTPDDPVEDTTILWVDTDGPGVSPVEFVRKAGDTMTGALRITANGGDQRLAPITGQMRLLTGDGSGYANMALANPTAAEHAATKGYVDTRIQSGVAQTGGTSGEVAITFPVPFAGLPVVTVSGTTALALDAAQVGACIVENSITVNGFTARAYVASSGETTAAWALLWIAVGPVAAAEELPEEG